MIPVHWLPFLRACEWLAAPVLRGQRAERGPAPGRVSCRRRPGLGPQCDGLGQVPAAGEASGRRGSCPASAPPLGPRAVTGSFVDRRERNTFIHSLVIRQQAPLGSAESLLPDNSSPDPASPCTSARLRCWCSISRDWLACTCRSSSSSAVPGGSSTRSGSVLMNSPTMFSMPATSGGRVRAALGRRNEKLRPPV